MSLAHGTCAYSGPVGARLLRESSTAPRRRAFQPPQYFSTSGSTCSGVTSPATMTVVYCGRYQRSKNSFEYAYSFGMFSMSLMNPIVVCL